MVDKLTILTSIHVLAAALWVGTAFTLNLLLGTTGRSGDSAASGVAMRFADFLGPRVFAPLAVIVIASGIWLTKDYYDWDLWVVLGLIGAVTSMTLGFAYFAPKGRKMRQAVESGSAPDPGLMPLVGTLNLLMLVAIVVIMVIKPT